MKNAMLAGIVRVVPDILTFATPIFSDGAGNFLAQREQGDIVAGFDSASIDDEIKPLPTLMWASVGGPCIHGFEIERGQFLFGESPRLAEYLRANESRWKSRRVTADQVRRFINRVERDETASASVATSLVSAVTTQEGESKHIFFVERVSNLEPSTEMRFNYEPKSRALFGGFSEILQVRTIEELRWNCAKFVRELGFDYVSVLGVRSRPGEIFDGYSRRWFSPHDPVRQHVKRQSVPIIWDRQTYKAAGALDLWEEHAKLGYHTGIAMALHLPDDVHFVIGVDREHPLPDDEQEMRRVVADLQLFAVHAQDSALRLIEPATSIKLWNLTPRELEALRWTMEGKSAWEVGSILGTTERAAALRINSATHKLGCVNKHQAVLKALRLGLLR